MDIEPRPLGEQFLGDEQAIGTDDDNGRPEVETPLGPLGLEHRHAETFRDDLRRRGCNPAPTALARIGTGQQSRDLVLGSELLEHVRTERRRRCEGDQGHA